MTDAGAFLDEWGPRAAALGWSVADLFDPPGWWAPGLVWALEGGAVALLTDREAVFARDGRRVWFCIPPHGRGHANPPGVNAWGDGVWLKMKSDNWCEW